MEVLLILFMALGRPSPAREGYSMLHDRVVVRTKAHWEKWSFPKGTLDIEEGLVRPRFVRKGVNACLDAGDFVHEVDKRQLELFPNAWYDRNSRKWLARGGIKRAGTNPDDAQNVMDGNPDTFWEPNLEDPPQNWWIEVDLGRLVCATSIVLKFAEQGDPFLQFKVFTSTGERAFELSSAMNYVLAGETKEPNKTKKIFKFDLSPVEASDDVWRGRALQYILIVVTDSDRERAELVTEEEYRALPPDWKGAVDYIWKVAGEERVVTKEVYDKLPPEQRGGVRYYRRERPRLAELEVWTLGENIALGLLERGGSVSEPCEEMTVPVNAFDGIITTLWLATAYRETGYGAGWGLLTVDLGNKFWVDTICYVLKRGAGRTIGVFNGYLTRASDGSRAPDGSLIWERVSPKSKEIIWENMWRLMDRFEPRKVRYLEFRNLDILERRERKWTPLLYAGNVAELQVYGEGYVPEVVLTSPLVDLEGPKNITSIEWDAVTPPGTRIEVRTRTGDRLREVVRYFDRNGNEVSEQEYNRLPSFMKGDTLTEYLPGPDWSRWSRVYTSSESPFLSPSPRKYMMIQVKLLSDDPYVAPSIRSITVRFRRPVAREVAAEIDPDRGVKAGREQDFRLFIRPKFQSRDSGFDDILVACPGVRMKLQKLSLGDEEDFAGGTTRDFVPKDDAFVSQDGDTLKVFKDDADSLWVRLPKVVEPGGPKLVMVSFSSTLFSDGTVFQVLVGCSSIPGSWQKVDSKDVTGLSPGTGTKVLLKSEGRIVGDVKVIPNPFTPDGVNDEVQIDFSVFKVNAARNVGLEIYSLDGRLIRSFSELRKSAAGRYSFRWDGRDEGGKLVPPGVYIARIAVETDAAPVVLSCVVCIAY